MGESIWAWNFFVVVVLYFIGKFSFLQGDFTSAWGVRLHAVQGAKPHSLASDKWWAWLGTNRADASSSSASLRMNFWFGASGEAARSITGGPGNERGWAGPGSSSHLLGCLGQCTWLESTQKTWRAQQKSQRPGKLDDNWPQLWVPPPHPRPHTYRSAECGSLIDSACLNTGSAQIISRPPSHTV